MWPDRRLCNLFGVEHPIIQAPMVGSSTPELAIEVCNAGGLGSLGCCDMSADELRSVTAKMRAGTNKPFNLNFFVYPAPQTNAATVMRVRERLLPWYKKFGLGEPPLKHPVEGDGFDEAKLSLVLELRPPVVSFHFGVPDAAVLRALKNIGIVVISTATTVAEAKALTSKGVDAVIAQGWEAGGHRGSHSPKAPIDGVGTLALVPQIADAVDVPVIAAGGIGDGRGIAAAFALGASGVQIGTGFLSCPEAGTDGARRALLSKAKDTDTIVTDSGTGRAARVMRSRYSMEMELIREPLPAFPTMFAFSNPIYEAANADEASFHLYGQAAALNREAPAAVLMYQMIDEAFGVLARIGKSGS